MADVATAGAPEESRLADGEGGEVIVVHEAPPVFRLNAIDLLLLADGTQGGDGENLGLTAREQAGAVGAGQETDLAAHGPDLVRAAVVRPPALAENAGAHGRLGDIDESGLELTFGVGFAQGLDELLEALGHRLSPFVFGAGNEVPVLAADKLLNSGPHLLRED